MAVNVLTTRQHSVTSQKIEDLFLQSCGSLKSRKLVEICAETLIIMFALFSTTVFNICVNKPTLFIEYSVQGAGWTTEKG